MNKQLDTLAIHIADKVTYARKSAGLTQEILAKKLEVSFQQLQKYESGINRISANRLYTLAKITGRDASFFFPDNEEELVKIDRYLLDLIPHLAKLPRDAFKPVAALVLYLSTNTDDGR